MNSYQPITQGVLFLVLIGCFFTSVSAKPEGKAPMPEAGGITWQDSTPIPELGFQSAGILGNVRKSVNVLAFSPDGTLMATSHHTRHIGSPALVVVWDLIRGTPRFALHGHTIAVLSGAFSPDGSLLATGGQCDRLFFWDMKTGKQLGESHLHAGHVYTLSFTPDGKHLLSSSIGLRLWDARTQHEIKRFHEPSREHIFRAIISPDGKRVLTANDSNLHLYDFATGKHLAVVDKGLWPSGHRIAFTPDGGKIITGRFWDGYFRLWETATGKPHVEWDKKLTFAPRELLFFPNADTIVTRGSHPNDSSATKLQVVHWQTGKELSHIDCQTIPTSFRVTPDAKLLVVGGLDGSLGTYRVSDGQLVRTLLHPPQPIFAVRFLSKDKLLSVTKQSVVQFWDRALQKEERRGQLRLPAQDALVALSPAGKHLATCDRDGTLRLWQAGTGKLCWQHDNVLAFPLLPRALEPDAPSPSPVRSSLKTAVFSGDGQWLAAPIRAGTVAVWDTTTGKERCQIKVPFAVQCLALSRKHLVCAGTQAGDAVRIFELTDGKERDKIQLPPYSGVGWATVYIESLHLSADGRRLAIVQRTEIPGRRESVHYERQIHLWDIDDIRSLAEADFEQIQKHIGQLGSPTFAIREHASRKLETYGPAVLLSLRVALTKSDLETRRRIADIIRKLENKGRTLPGLSGRAAAFSPDGKFLAYHLPYAPDPNPQQGALAVWDIERQQLARTSQAMSDIGSLAFSSDSATVAATFTDTVILLWDVANLFREKEQKK